MRTLLLLLILYCLGIRAGNCPNYPSPVPLGEIHKYPVLSAAFKALDSMLQSQQKALGFPGLVCSVVYDQNIIWHRGYGLNNPFNSSATSPPTIDSIVRVASITKVFTDLMMMQLRDAGMVDLDDPVETYIPSFSVMNPYNTKKDITLRELASHTSGLQREVPCPWADLSQCTEAQILAAAAKTYVLFPQYTRAHYSNFGLALLGRTLEKAAGMKYETYVEQNILKPLGMANSTFEYSSTVRSKMAIGSSSLPNGTVIPSPIQDLGWGNPMGGLFASARDMSRVISQMFRRNNTQGPSQILDGSTIAEVLSPVIVNRDGYSGFGMPWEFKYINQYWVKSKAGSLPGYRSQVAIVPPIRVGIFCVGTADSDDSTMSMLTEPSLQLLLPAFTQVLWSLQKPPPPPPNAQLFTGLYQNVDPVFGVSMFEVYLEEDQEMFAAFTDGESAFDQKNLTQFDATTFRAKLIQPQECRWLNDGEDSEFIYFTIDRSGMFCSSLTFMSTPYTFVSKNCPQCS